MFAFAAGVASGGFVVWFAKDTVASIFLSVDSQVTALEAKLAALKAKP